MYWTQEEIKELTKAKFYPTGVTFMEISREVDALNMVYDFVVKSRRSYTSVVHYKKHMEVGIDWAADKNEFDTFDELMLHLLATVDNWL